MFSDLLIVCVKAAPMALDNYCFTNFREKLLLFLLSVLIIFILSAVLFGSHDESTPLVGVDWHAPRVCRDILRGVNVLSRPALPLLSSFFFSSSAPSTRSASSHHRQRRETVKKGKNANYKSSITGLTAPTVRARGRRDDATTTRRRAPTSVTT